MPVPPPQHRPQTLKQARAAYKARGGPTISEAERRKLERADELDRRAARLKEAEKRRVEAAKKRAEKEGRDGGTEVQLATQRTCDKFGYKSSQMHLGAFLNKSALAKRPMEQKESIGIPIQEEVDFGDSDMDDETLLEALDGALVQRAAVSRARPLTAHSQDAYLSARAPVMLLNTPEESYISPTDDFLCFFDEFGSSTQIAKELDADQSDNDTKNVQPALLAACYDTDEFDDFDFTTDELEKLDPTLGYEKRAAEDRTLMPPPPLPTKQTPGQILVDAGFTISELEQLVDDDLQLTQAEPG